MNRLYLLLALFGGLLFSETKAQCSADFQFIANNGLQVFFSDTSFSPSGSPSYLWEFSTGVTSTQQNPTYTFPSSGTYLVCLTITDSTCTDSICKLVTVNGNSPCSTSFSYSVSPNNNVTFSANTFGGGAPFSYLWNFGDSTSGTGVNPTHQYNSTGIYNVQLTVTDSNNVSCSATDTVVVRSCNAFFNTTVNNDTVHIQNLAASFSTVFYDFGDGNNSSQTNPSHIYSNSGTYVICQTTIDSLTNCSDVFCDTININIPQPCIADFTSSTQANVVSITNLASNYSTIYYDFGDGSTSNFANPTHTYNVSGTYTICQTVTNNNGCSSTYCDSVNVQLPCKAGFSFTTNINTVNFTNQATNYSSITYDFGDGTSSNQINPTHSYANSGSYVVCQTITNQNGCTDTFCDTVTVRVIPNCSAGFSHSTINDTTSFLATASSFNRVKYYFGDGDSSLLINPKHQYLISGNYTVTQIVFNDTIQCIDTISKNINVSISTSCFASFKLALDTTDQSTLYLINNSSNDNSHNYFWNFGDGFTSTQKNPTHQYSENKPYPICLTVSDSSQNCTSTYCDTVGLDTNGNILKAQGFTLKVIDGSAIGIKEQSLGQNVNVFPNPFKNSISIQHSLGNELTYSLFDIQGRIIREGKVQSTQLLNTSELKTGLYVLVLRNGLSTTSKKLIKN